MTTVVVLGATGVLGQRVCRLLQRWAPAAQLIGANRSGAGHKDFPVRKVDVASEEALRELLSSAELVVNAVGPYRYDPAPLVRASVDSGCHYCDLSEDLEYLARVERLGRARSAAPAGVTLVPGCSTVPGLVQLLAGHFSADSRIARVSAWLSMGSRNEVSAALMAGLLAPLGRAGTRGPRWFTRLEKAEGSDGRRLLYGSYPAPYPSAGLRLGQRRVPVRFRVGFDRAWVTRALRLAAPLLGRLPERAIPGVAAVASPFARALRPLGTLLGSLTVRGEDADGRERACIEVRARAAGLDIPAAPPVWLAMKLLEEGGLGAAGVVGLDRVVSFERATAWLRGAGYEVLGDRV